MTYTEGTHIWYETREGSDSPIPGLQLATVMAPDSTDNLSKSFVWDKKNGRYTFVQRQSFLNVKKRFTESWNDETAIDADDVVGEAKWDYLDTIGPDEQLEFFGVDGYAFKLGDTVLVAVEDPNDGYRSALGTIVTLPEGRIFFRNKVADVFVVQVTDENHGDFGTDFEGYALVDAKDGHVWLFVGTDNSADYYPVFTFTYTPKQEVK